MAPGVERQVVSGENARLAAATAAVFGQRLFWWLRDEQTERTRPGLDRGNQLSGFVEAIRYGKLTK
jgi:hypothetical protein